MLFDGSEILPSAIWRDPASGELLTGRDALHRAQAAPESLEPNPKRCIDDTAVLLGAVEVPVADLLAAILRRVATEAGWTDGDEAVLTCPAEWGPPRRAILAAAARQAGLGTVAMAAEPIAAAAGLLRRAPSEAPVVVYDFGAGTFDASVVQHTAAGLQVLAGRGLTDVGGLDIDAAVAASIEQVYTGRDRPLWQRLTHPETSVDRRARRQWMQEVRAGKEALSRTASTTMFVPLFDDETVLGREEFEGIARPFIAATVEVTRNAIVDAGFAVRDLAAVLLVGGSSRIPLVATMIHRALDVAPTVVERPELAVAAGSLQVPADA
ncbi:Hsp70 protein [Cryptosporangium aurantiacum]|uniref:Hsp70 protein n=1 Tax=Cryptosporangium aurantiacum TaxID=134849 RepID=A0A1M7PBT0_9ACTN|nr:Hsp70 protein [Cryptosporangium aurantiacum]